MKTPSFLRSIINRGEIATLSIPRASRVKLWNWCRRYSNDGLVRVRVQYSHDYSTKEIQERVRIGRAYPTIFVRSTWDDSLCRYVISGSEIYWSFVY